MLRFLCIAFAFLLLSSCGSNSLVGRRVDNFTAYYNTFYNAERVFAEAEKSVQVEDPPVNLDVYLSIYPVQERVGNRQSFENSIKKSADILREHENSKWIDDALLLIGKSYYYTQNYVSARRYFNDVIEVSDKLDAEAQIWLGRTLIASGLNEEAVQHLTLTLNSDNLQSKSASVLQLQLGDAYVRTGAFESARDQLVLATASLKDKDLRARGAFLLGQVYETLGDSLDALEAYERAGRHEPLYELSFAAQVKAIEIIAASDADEAVRQLRRMERDDKNFAYRGKLALLRGRVLMAQGEHVEARDHLREALLEEVRIDPDALGKAHYELGRMHESSFVDYPRAAAHYDTSATSLRNRVQQTEIAAIRSNIAVPFAPGAITDAVDKAEVFGAFSEAYQQVAHYDSLLALGALDKEAFDEKIQELRRLRLEEMEEQRRQSERRAIEQDFRNSSVTSGVAERDGAKQTGTSAVGATSAESGFLSYKDPIRMRAGVQSFIELWGTRPLVDNWRIESKLIREATSGEEADGENTDGSQPAITLENIEFLPNIDVSDVPRTEAARTDVRRDRAEARYLVGNVLFLSMNKPDSASHWYGLVVEEDAEFEVSERALFALMESTRATGDEQRAAELEKQLLDKYPDSDFARRVSQEPIATDPVADDSTLIALSEDYRVAFEMWTAAADFEGAFVEMLEVAAASPDSVLAPRALMASTSIYHEWARVNEVDPLLPVQFEIGDSLADAIGIYDMAMRRALEAVASDSVSLATDSTGVADSLAVSDSLEMPVDADQPLEELPEIADDDAETVRAAEKDAFDEPELDVVDVNQQVADAADEGADEAADEAADEVAEPIAADRVVVQADSLVVDSLQLEYYLRDIFAAIELRYPESEFAQQVAELVLVDDSAPAAAETGAVADEKVDARRVDGDTVDGNAVDEDVGAGSGEVDRSDLELRRGRPQRGDVAFNPAVPEGDVEQESESEEDSAAAVGAPGEEIRSEPVLIGGMESIQSRLRFPEEVGDFPDGGVVVVEFVITSDGFVSNPRILAGLNDGFNQEALRVIRSSRFRPAVNTQAQPVAFQMQLDIEFTPVGAEEQ